MKYPIYIVNDEPRVRRRMWSQDKRVRAAAREAILLGSVPERFMVSLPAPHPSNKNPNRQIGFLVGQMGGIVTSIVTIVATTSL